MILFIFADAGLTLALIAAGSAIASMIGSGISSHQNRKAQQRINEQQMQMAEETNQFNANEAQKERDWNDYSNQSARMLSAGLNPATMFGGQGSPINSNAQANGVTPPSLGVPSFDNMFGDTGSFEQIASAINQISNANLTEKQRQDLINTTVDRYKQIASDASKTEFERQMAEIDADFYQNYGMELKRNEFQVVKNTSNKLYREVENLVKQGEFIDAETALSKARKETEEEVKKFKGKEREILEARLKRIDELIDNEIKESKSRQYANVTGANAAMVGASAQAEDLRATRAARIDQMVSDARHKKSLAKLNEYEFDTNPSKMMKSWSKFTNMCYETLSGVQAYGHLKLQMADLQQQINLAIKHNDYYLATKLMEMGRDIAISMSAIAMARKSYNTGGKTPNPVKVQGFQ